MVLSNRLADLAARTGEAARRLALWQQIERRPDGSATITFRRPKTDADTTAYLVPATVAALDEIRHGAADTVPLFNANTSRIKARIKAAAKGRRAGWGFKPRMPDRNGAGPRTREGNRDARHHAGRRLAIGDDRSRIHRPRSRHPWRRSPFPRAGNRAVTARDVARVTRFRYHFVSHPAPGPRRAPP